MWKSVIGYEGLYEVSSEGQVRNSSGKVLSPYKHKGKWLKVSLWNGTSKKNYPVHRLVALAFIPNPSSKLEVNHISLQKEDNRVSNLEWVTGIENRKHYRDSVHSI
jgi:hypothetical protein